MILLAEEQYAAALDWGDYAARTTSVGSSARTTIVVEDTMPPTNNQPASSTKETDAYRQPIVARLC